MTIDCEAFWVRTIIAQPLDGILVFSFFQKQKKNQLNVPIKKKTICGIFFSSNQSALPGKFMFLHNRQHNLLKR